MITEKHILGIIDKLNNVYNDPKTTFILKSGFKEGQYLIAIKQDGTHLTPFYTLAELHTYLRGVFDFMIPRK